MTVCCHGCLEQFAWVEAYLCGLAGVIKHHGGREGEKEVGREGCFGGSKVICMHVYVLTDMKMNVDMYIMCNTSSNVVFMW